MWVWLIVISLMTLGLTIIILSDVYQITRIKIIRTAIIGLIISSILVFGCKWSMDTGLLWTMFPAPPVAQGYTSTFLNLVESCGEDSTLHFSNRADFDHNDFILCMESNGVEFVQHGDPVK